VTPAGLPFTPPAVALTQELRWVLGRAFGPTQGPWRGALDGAEALRLAGALCLAERIGARVAPPPLLEELGREAALSLSAGRLATMARMRRLSALIPDLASLAAAEGVPVVLVKFAGLHAGGHLAEGARSASDLDLLLRRADAEHAFETLRGRGWLVSEVMTADHHLPPLLDDKGRLVELHTHLPGLAVPGTRRFAGFDALLDAGALEPAPGLGPYVHLLRRAPMVAHLVAHGLAHHGGADAYPVTRMLGDVIDLLPGRLEAGLGEAREWMSGVSAAEVEAVATLCEALENGALEGMDTVNGGRPAELLLRHVLAGALDPGYRSGLVVAHVLRPLTDEPRWWKMLKTVRRAAFPPRAQLAARMGGASRGGRLRRRLAHAAAFAGHVSRLALNAIRGHPS
jgi:hypothetical protein